MYYVLCYTIYCLQNMTTLCPENLFNIITTPCICFNNGVQNNLVYLIPVISTLTSTVTLSKTTWLVQVTCRDCPTTHQTFPWREHVKNRLCFLNVSVLSQHRHTKLVFSLLNARYFRSFLSFLGEDTVHFVIRSARYSIDYILIYSVRYII